MSTSQSNVPVVGSLDRQLLGIYALFLLFGWMMIFAAEYKPGASFSLFSLDTLAGKQFMFIVLCSILTFVILMTDWSFWRTFAVIIYLLTLFALPWTALLGREINGAHAWYQFGGFSLQPSELTKFGVCLALAAYLSTTGVSLREWRGRLIAMSIFMVPALIVVLIQNDTGTGIVFMSFMLVLYREGLPSSWYALGFSTAALVILGLIFEPPYVASALLMLVNWNLINRFKKNYRLWQLAFVILIPITYWWADIFQWGCGLAGLNIADFPGYKIGVLVPHLLLFLAAFLPNYLRKNSQIQGQLQIMALLLVAGSALVFAANFACYTLLAPHQQQRIKIWLKPAEATDTRGQAYNILHSKMAIGSGGFMGKGLLEGNMTNLRYVPAQTTDFIFCTIGEEQGFLGVVGVVILFAWLLLRIVNVAERQRSNFSRIYAYCVAGVIFVHFIVNIGMTMGIFPIIGIPLPFLSSGGSSLIGFTLMIAVLLKLDSNRGLA
jgi:rod shape determining protein RodA